jgi:hypothetical protein
MSLDVGGGGSGGSGRRESVSSSGDVGLLLKSLAAACAQKDAEFSETLRQKDAEIGALRRQVQELQRKFTDQAAAATVAAGAGAGSSGQAIVLASPSSAFASLAGGGGSSILIKSKQQSREQQSQSPMSQHEYTRFFSPVKNCYFWKKIAALDVGKEGERYGAWEAFFEPSTGSYFFFNSITAEISYEREDKKLERAARASLHGDEDEDEDGEGSGGGGGGGGGAEAGWGLARAAFNTPEGTGKGGHGGLSSVFKNDGGLLLGLAEEDDDVSGVEACTQTSN